MIKKLIINGVEISVNIKSTSGNSVVFEYMGCVYSYSKAGAENLLINDHGQQFKISSPAPGVFISEGRIFKVEEFSHSPVQKDRAEGSLISPLPGRIISVVKKKGEKVEKGETVLIIEAMKMEHRICAELDGSLSELTVKEGDTVSEGQKLGEIQ